MKNKRTVIAAVIIVAAIVALVVLDIVKPVYCGDGAANAILSSFIPRLISAAAVTAAAVFAGLKGLFVPKKSGFSRTLLWCLPCFAVVLANFPFTALFSGAAKITRWELLPLFIADCLAIGYLEELLFRGIVQDSLSAAFAKRKNPTFMTILTTSGSFAFFHTLNLFAGAGVATTALQIGYSFLIGAMLSAVMIRGKNLWLCAFLHAAFDFGGGIVTALGSGEFQDIPFWIFTAVAGVICAVHVIVFIVKQDSESASATQ